MFRCLIAALTLAASAGTTAVAHPHIFVDTGMQIEFDADGRMTGIRVVWVYDELYSLLIIEDRGLDRDYDGVLTDAERADLAGFDMNWQPGYQGDLYPNQGADALALSGPADWTADFREGRIITTHLRRLNRPADPAAAPVSIAVYDPTYYTSYSIVTEPQILGRDDCRARILVPDPTAASAELRAALAELGADETYVPEDDFPAIGDAFAEEVELTCAARS